MKGGTPAFVPARSLYVHVPFCVSKCAYCDFHSFAKGCVEQGLMERIVEATIARVGELVARFGGDIETVYVGGGTPTVLGADLMDRLLDSIEKLCRKMPAEWTVEANPESLDSEMLEVFRAHPVSRLSLGIQSMVEEELALLGRPCGVGENRRAIDLASGSGLRLSADLMTALPRPAEDAGDHDPEVLAQTAVALAESGFSHLSIYDLVPEEGTALAAGLASGALAAADPDASADCRALAEKALSERGMLRYEISNYALPGEESRHNMAYWAMESYIGAGSGAVSTLRTAQSPGANTAFCGSLRIEEGLDLARYALDPGSIAKETALSPGETAFEMVMMGFRTVRGLDCTDFGRRFGMRPEKILERSLRKWAPMLREGRGGSGFLALDGRGMDLANRFLVDCLEDMDGARLDGLA
jgi:oxygen-independent coproporphyrinogen-3 oxidase